ncbi:hypothetical protein ACTWP6_00475 [Mycobacterium sp. 4D054]|nr:hypothetical protein [Mycobacterium sp. SMC-8]UXA10554.1 hypothetical protein KXD97_20910 [Mycobacterium sp. SMC-8]
MTALQDWLTTNPVDTLTCVLRDAWRGLTSGDAEQADEPQLMGPGLERC